MYESPIRLLVQQLETNIREQQEKQIFEAVQKYGVDVDREELIKALAYDRAQYVQGYSDGRADAQRWISVEERLPESNDDVIVFVQHPISGHCWMQTAHQVSAMGLDECEDDEWWLSGTGETVSYITHWMPLPEPPKEE